MRSEKTLHAARIASSIAATAIALACGTNYVYSAWGPQFADRLKLSSTEGNLVGAAGNLGMYSMGIPIGIFVDSKGSRPAAILGTVLLVLGYFPLHLAYDRGSGYVPLLCVFSFFTGLGGCAAFAASIKVSALNWPEHRGTATAFPLAAFGLSAFFFSMFSRFVFPGSTGDFLVLLSFGTSGLILVSSFFLQVLPHPSSSSSASYAPLPTNAAGRARVESSPLRRTKTEENGQRGVRGPLLEPGAEVPAGLVDDADEVSSLMSSAVSEATPGEERHVDRSSTHNLDIRGMELYRLTEFWIQFALMGVLTGIGLMTINNIGNDATALWRHYDPSVSPEFITKSQAMHVSILSVCSFLGRLLSGVGSDFLVKKLHASRYWCIVVASLIFSIAQICALQVMNPHYLGTVSGFTGLAYGFLFGVYPSLVAEAFGVASLSQNWGTMTLSPIVSGNVFNLFYGMVYDRHSVIEPDGERMCDDGKECYHSAYGITFISCLVGLAISLWAIHHEKGKTARVARARQRAEHHEA